MDEQIEFRKRIVKLFLDSNVLVTEDLVFAINKMDDLEEAEILLAELPKEELVVLSNDLAALKNSVAQFLIIGAVDLLGSIGQFQGDLVPVHAVQRLRQLSAFTATGGCNLRRTQPDVVCTCGKSRTDDEHRQLHEWLTYMN